MDQTNRYASPLFHTGSNTAAQGTTIAETSRPETPTVFTRTEQSSEFFTVQESVREPADLAKIFSAHKNSAIHTLDLSASELKEAMWAYLLGHLNDRAAVNTLNLSYCGFELAASGKPGRLTQFGVFVRDLKAMPFNLIFRRCYMHFNAFNAIADRLKTDQVLQRLDLTENLLGLEGVQMLSSALQENSTLSEISLADNCLGAESVDVPANLVLNSKSLTKLDLSDNRFSPEDKAMLQQVNELRKGKPLVLVL